MSVICKCPSCKAKYQVGDEYAGRTIKCPKCSAAVVVPAATATPSPTAPASKTSSPGPAAKGSSSSILSKAELPKARPVHPVEEPAARPAPKTSSVAKIVKAVAIAPATAAGQDQASDATPAEGDGLGFLAEEAAKAKGRAGAKGLAAPAGAKPSPAGDGRAGDLAAISGLAAHSEEEELPAWLIATIAATGAAAFVVMGFAIYLASHYLSSQPAKVISDATAVAADGKKTDKTAKAEPKVPVLTLNWPENHVPARRC